MSRYDTGWQAADRTNKEQAEQAGDGLFVQLADDGESVRGVFVGAPLVRYRHWNGAGMDNCDGDACGWCAQKLKVKVQYALSFFDTDAKAMRVISLSTMTYPQLIEYRDNPQFGLKNWSYQVKRAGKKGDSNTTYMITPHAPLTPKQGVYIDSQDPVNLPHACGLVADAINGAAQPFPGTPTTPVQAYVQSPAAQPSPQRFADAAQAAHTELNRPTVTPASIGAPRWDQAPANSQPRTVTPPPGNFSDDDIPFGPRR